MKNGKKNIVFLIDSLQNSYGTERAVVSLCNELVKHYSITIISMDRQNHPCRFKLDENIIVTDLGIESRIKIIKFLTMFLKLKESQIIAKSDVVVSSLAYISVALLASCKFKNVICWEHASFSYFGKLFNSIRCYFYKNSNITVTLTEHDKSEFFRRNIRAHLIPNIVEISSENKRSSNNNGRFLFVGRLSDEKGIHELIQILDYLYNKHSEIDQSHKTIIIGSGPLEEYLKKEIINNSLANRVEVIGYVDNVSDYYERADLLLCTSRSESFGIAILEAANHNVPTISFADCLGPCSLIIDGKTGILIEPRIISIYSEKLVSLHKSVATLRELGSDARKQSDKFSSKTLSISWIKIIDETING